MMDNRIAKWIRWLDVIEWNVQSLVLYKHMFWEIQGIISANPNVQLNSAFHRYMGDTYVAFAAMGVRRQLKIDSQSISMARLLCELGNDPKRITLDYYLGLQPDSRFHPLIKSTFRQYCEGNQNHISSKKVQRDLLRLKSISRDVEDFADRRIAHSDSREPKRSPQFSDLNESIDKLNKLYSKYYLLLTGNSISSLMPTFQYDWKAIFKVPWIKV